MRYKVMLVLLAALCVGCAKPGGSVKIKSDCPPPTGREDILSQISESQRDMIEFAARGSATVRFLTDNRRESLPSVTAYFSDRRNVVIKVSHTFGTAMVLGTNPDWFWCWINFSKVNDYYSGTTSQLESCGAKGLKTFPVAEALGIIDAASIEHGLVFFEDAEYGIEVSDAAGSRLRSYYFNNCTKNLVRIIYYEQDSPVVVAEFGGYKILSGSTALPTDIKVYSTAENLELNIKVDRFIPLTLSQSKKDKLYSTPEPAAGAQIYELDGNCQFMP